MTLKVSVSVFTSSKAEAASGAATRWRHWNWLKLVRFQPQFHQEFFTFLA